MKRLLFTALMLVSLNAISQKSVISDPALGKISISGMNGQPLDVDNLPIDQAIRIKLPISNFTNGRMLPAGSCKIKLGFGSKLALDPAFSLVAAELHEYFSWTASMVGGQLQLTGDLVNPLPAGLTEVGLMLKAKGTVLGTSTITANFLLSNHNTGITLSDADPTNNSSYLKYTVTGKKAVAVVKINDMAREACKINLAFGIDRETNISRYDVEVSKDGFGYVKVGEVAANGAAVYTTAFDLTDAIRATDIFVRIRAVDMDGAYIFSAAKAVSGNCAKEVAPWVLTVYPNPATDVKAVTIAAKQGTFNGKYKVTVLDMGGRLAQVKELQLNNQSQVNYDLGTLGAGKYLIQVSNADGSQSAVLPFEKL